MKQTPLTNDDAHNDAFLTAHLQRHHGDARKAGEAAHELAEMGPYGREWFHFIEAKCLLLAVSRR